MNVNVGPVVLHIINVAAQPMPHVDLHSSSSESSNEDSEDEMALSDDEVENGIIHPFQPQGQVDLLFPFMHHLMHGRAKSKVVDYLATVRRKSNEEFRAHFRLPRLIAYELIDQLAASGAIPTHDYGKPKKSAELSFLMFLWYIANEEPLRILGELFDMSESSVFRIIRRVVDWLVTLLNEYVKWPEGEAVLAVSQGFAEPRGLRKCIGAVDGCQIPIIKPCIENAQEYFNYKQKHSINLTAIVDSRKIFTMVYCGDPGSYHDSRVFRRSAFFQRALADQDEIFPDDTFIIGDGGYVGVNNDWLVHPFRDTGHLTPEQRSFNRMLSSTRVFVEQAFGILKGRFRRLLHRLHMFDLPLIVDLIISCCILHNICILNGEAVDDYYVGDQDADGPVNEVQQQNADNEGQATRRRQLFSELFPHAVYPNQA